jgi:hypothetical protein
MSCKTKQVNNCKPYFEFDAIEHYSISLSLDEETRLMELDSLSPKELRLNDVLLQSRGTQLTDTSRFINLEDIGFKSRIVDASKFEEINSLFCKKEHKEILATSCIPFYRDILIFRRKGKIVGTAKIFFECWYHVIAGANVNTDDFGQSGDYARLKKLLYQKSKTVD